MIKELRKEFNAKFNEEIYKNFTNELNTILPYPTDFRVSETPLFISDNLRDELINGCYDILSQLQTKEFLEQSKNAIPKELSVPNEDEHPVFLQIDFAVTQDSNGNFVPKLIELQGFPSLYGFQYYLNKLIEKHFHIPKGFTPYFSGLSESEYAKLFKETLLGNEDPEQTILLEIEPEKQKTRIDFAATEALTGVKAVCLTKVLKKGNKLFYNSNGKEIEIKRIYNRCIFDEIQRKNINFNFSFSDELDVKWVGHPNWFFRISKYTLPFLKGKYVPECHFLSDLKDYPSQLNNYVLKPLFSFAGLGVEIDFDKERLDSIQQKDNYVLQEKIEYAPLIETPDEFSKVEIRMMFLWNDKPILVNNLIRQSKGKMMGVDFNKNKTWVGSSCGYHR